jgi:BlaI family transcriptional regulator, penicillinase repressor
MAKPPSISQAEWEVMRVIWESAPVSANEVVERLSGRKPWCPATIKTMLNRLVNKRALTYQAQGKRYLYRPRASEDQCIRTESRSFLHRVFGGELGPMLNYFVRTAKLSPRQIAELRRILDEKEE